MKNAESEICMCGMSRDEKLTWAETSTGSPWAPTSPGWPNYKSRNGREHEAHKWRETKNMRGRSWQVKRIKDGGGKEGRGEAGWLVRWRVCSSGLPGVVRDSSICLRTAVARSLPRAHRYSSRTCTLALFVHICKSQWPQATVAPFCNL